MAKKRIFDEYSQTIRSKCANCGDDFEVRSSNHKFCSKKCREDYKKKLKNKKDYDKKQIDFWTEN